ncbi:MAG: acyltransferase [Oscillospiraceae bacterium]
MEPTTAHRRCDYDVLRILSMLAVIYLHTAAGALREIENIAVWHFSNVATSLASIAVPLFFMLSGSLLLGSEKTLEVPYLLKKRMPKILVPFLCWSGIFLLVTALGGDGAGALTAGCKILSTPVTTPYWFVYALVPMYLLSPLLKKMTDGMEERHWNYLLALWFGLTLGLNTLCTFASRAMEPMLALHPSMNVNVVAGYLGYFLLGRRLELLKKPPARKFLWCGFFLLWGGIALGTWWLTARTGVYDGRLTEYLNLFVPLLAGTAFLLAKTYLRGKRERGKLLPLLAGVSFGVYLLHPMMISWVWEQWYLLLHSAIDTVPEQLSAYLVTAALCVVGIVAVSSVKFLCYPLTGQRFAVACKECNLFALGRRSKKKNPQ